tara:strand:+ start:1065 stop:1403 length:339 start_codon:yes stop_codon:yes gene_type:complete
MNPLVVIAIAVSHNIKPSESVRYTGQQVQVCGDLVSIKMPDNDFQPHIISMENEVDIVVWSNDIPKIEIAPSNLVGDKACVTGKLEVYKSKPQIVLKNHGQIKIVNAKDENI